MSTNVASRTRRHWLLSAGAAGFLATAQPRRQQPQRRVIIDTDPGVDDALAIFLAARSPELKIEALTPVAGNVPLELTLPNALRLLEIAGRTDIPVAAGANQPLKRRHVTATYAHGENGLAGVPFPPPKTKPVSETATQLIRRMVRKSPGEIHLIALGPLTNIAQAFLEDPELPRMIPSLTLMGGSLSGGNITPAAEFNIYADPDAAQAVFRTAGLPITMVGLDVTRKATIAEPEVRMLEAAATNDPVSRAAGQITRAALNRKLRQPPGTVTIDLAMHDSLAVAAFLDPSVVTLQDFYVEVETAGEYTAGETLGYSKSPMRRSAPLTAQAAMGTSVEARPFQPNAKVAVALDRDRFAKLLLSRLTSRAS